MKMLCVQRCYFKGVRRPGDVVDVPDSMLGDLMVRTSFGPYSPGDTTPPAEEALSDGDGNPLPPSSQMTHAQIDIRLRELGVRWPRGLTKQKKFELLQDALAPHRG